MENKNNIIQNTRAKRITRVYDKMGNCMTTLSTPKISKLKQSARNRLNGVRKRAQKYGYEMNGKTYESAIVRIREIEIFSQYLNFVEDTKHVARNLSEVIKSQRACSAYFIKSTKYE